MRITKRHIQAGVSIIAVSALFFASSYYAREYIEPLSVFVARGGVLAMVVYVVIVIAAIVLAPVTSVPLVPVAAAVWGVAVATVLSTIGSVCGALIAFGLGRRFGIPIVRKLINEQRLAHIRQLIPQRHLFWWTLVLRFITPVDALSYAIGIFTKIKWRPYLLATTIGVIPFELFYAYTGTLSLRLQLSLAGIALILFALVWIMRTTRIMRMLRQWFARTF